MTGRNWQSDIDDPARTVEGADDIRQCLYVILTTVPGSDPLRPDFGSDVYRYIDRPYSEMQSGLVYAAVQAIGKWEKRIEVSKCSLSPDGIDGITLTIEGKVTATGQQYSTAIKLR